MFFSVAFSPSLNTVSGPFGQMSFSFVVTLLELSRGFAAARRSVFFSVSVPLVIVRSLCGAGSRFDGWNRVCKTCSCMICLKLWGGNCDTTVWIKFWCTRCGAVPGLDD